MTLPFTRPFTYSWGAARSDLTAGATVAAIAVPQAIAYALIAGVDPRYGLYSAIVVTIVAAILGSSNHLINGPTNAISLVVFSALASFTGHVDTYQALFMLAIIAGTIQILIAVLKLGDLTRYVSESVVLGFMAGAGILIAVGQIGNFVGAPKKGTGDQSVLVNTWVTLAQGVFNLRAIGLGIGTIVVVLLIHRVITKYKLPRVDMLAGLILASLVAAYFGWSTPTASGKTIVSVVGAIPSALPSFHLPKLDFGSLPNLFRGGLAIALLGLIEALAVAKSIATYTRQPLDYNRQCLAEGTGNLIGGFFQSMPGSGSLTRSAINYQAGAVTRASGLYSGIIVAIVVLALGPYARFIPKAVLAGLLFITAARLIDWKRLAYAIRASRFDAAILGATAFTAIFIDVEDSVLVGVALSILLFLPRASKPRLRELIVTPQRIIRERCSGDERSPSLLIYDLEGELFFGAAPIIERYFAEMIEATRQTDVKCIVLRLKQTWNPDVVVVEQLERFLHDADKLGVKVLLAGIRPEFTKILENVGVTSWFPADQIFPEEENDFSATLRAVRHAGYFSNNSSTQKVIRVDTHASHSTDDEPIYYLV